MDSPTATFRNAKMPLARWTNASDLAMVKSWFYPQHVKAGPKSRSKIQKQTEQNFAFDPYAPEIDLDALAQNDEDEDDDEVDHNLVNIAEGESGLSFITTEAKSASTEKPKLDASETLQRNWNKRRAIERVQAYQWHDRRVPHAITATAELIDAQLHYEESFVPLFVNYRSDADADADDEAKPHAHTGCRISQGAMTSIFAMAFCRFVNGFVDRDVVRSRKAMRETGLGPTGLAVAVAGGHGLNTSNLPTGDRNEEEENVDSDSDSEDDSDENNGKNPTAGTGANSIPKGAGESSMYKHAGTIGMPISFIDLRHRATHDRELPSLTQLRTYTDHALKWLWDKWWKVHVKGSVDAELRIRELQKWDEAVAEVDKERSKNVGILLSDRERKRKRHDVDLDMDGDSVRNDDNDDGSSSDRNDNQDGIDKNHDGKQSREWRSVVENGWTKFVRVPVDEGEPYLHEHNGTGRPNLDLR